MEIYFTKLDHDDSKKMIPRFKKIYYTRNLLNSSSDNGSHFVSSKFEISVTVFSNDDAVILNQL